MDLLLLSYIQGQEIFVESQLCSCNCLGHNNGAMGKGKDPLWVSLGEISPSILFSLLKYYYTLGLSLSSRNLINKFLYNFFSINTKDMTEHPIIGDYRN